ncbi:O-antigen ligase family protein, partial [Akkermansiaceae bacterium]|nr:O-antigen ligase family protein [Akkermansiaceae bacterium]
MASIIGLVINAPLGLRLTDIFQILRLFYMVELIALGYLLGRYFNKNDIIKILFISASLIFVLAYINPMNEDVLGFVQIWNPNVVGNHLAHCVILILALSGKIDKRTIILCLLLLSFSFFTYSKASWLLICFSSLAIFIKIQRFHKVIFLLGLIFLIRYNAETISTINILFNAKLDASDFFGTAASGSSVGARIGLAYSGFLMFLENPIFGVGIGNFEISNDNLRGTLGQMYYDDDNANSLFFHYLGTTGLLGCSGVILLIFQYFKLLTFSVKSKTIITLIMIYLGITVNFQRELFTTNPMYLFIGILSYK